MKKIVITTILIVIALAAFTPQCEAAWWNPWTWRVNNPPVLEPIGDKTVEVGSTLEFTVKASDPDGTTPRLMAYVLPNGASFVDHGDGTGTFSWQPQIEGTYYITFKATDWRRFDIEDITITVTAPVDPPVEPEPEEPPIVNGPNPRVGACYLHDSPEMGRDEETLAVFWNAMADTQAGSARYDALMSVIHPAPDVWNWDRMDEFFAQRREGVRVWVTVYHNALWNLARADEVEQAMAWARQQYPYAAERIPSGAPLDPDVCREFTRAIVERYKDRGLWVTQFENEVYQVGQHIAGVSPFNGFWLGTEADLKANIAAGLQGVNDADPTMHVALAGVTTECDASGPAIYGRMHTWMLTQVSADRLYGDLHLYCCQSLDKTKITAMKRLIGTVPLVISETGEIDTKCDANSGWLGREWSAAEEDRQAELLEARLNGILEEDIEAVFVLCFGRPNARNEGVGNRWTHFRLILEDGRKTKAYQKYKECVEAWR